tara:strand:+ start:437 stop:610 length:174 start_codon:yes stop_codon:yes gene_type:complete
MDKNFHTAIVYVMENSNSVIVHFGGFKNAYEAWNFGDELVEKLDIQKVDIPQNRTIH